MNEELDKLKIKSILSLDEVTFSSFENELAEKFNVSPEKLREMLIESESIEELLEKLDIQ